MILMMFRSLLIVLCFSSFSAFSEELPIVAPFMPEAYLKADKEEKKKSAHSTSTNKSKKTVQRKELGQRNTIDEGYSPSLTESLNDSSHLKSKIKRQLARDEPSQTEWEEDPSPEEFVSFGDVTISISERKKEETLVEKRKEKN